MTRLLEDNDSLLVLEFGDHVWIYHQNMISLKKDLSGRGFGLLEERMPVNLVWGVLSMRY